LKNYIFLTLIIISYQVKSQRFLDEILTESMSGDSTSLSIKNEIINNKKGTYIDSIIGTVKFIPPHLLIKNFEKDSSGKFLIIKNLSFINCKFPDALILANFRLEGELFFDNCTFPNGIVLSNLDGNKIKFSNNTLNKLNIDKLSVHRFKMDGDKVNESIEINGSSFYKELDIDVSAKDFWLTNNLFKVPKPSINLQHPNLFNSGKPTQIITVNIENLESVEIGDNQFPSKNDFDIVSFRFPSSQIGDIGIFNNTFGGIFELEGKSEFLNMFGNNFNKVDFSNFSFPEFNTVIVWKDISGKRLANVYNTGNPKEYIPKADLQEYFDQMNIDNEHESWTPQFYFGETEKELMAKWFFDNHVSVYYRIYQSYRSLGRLEDANSVYVEMKNIENGRLKYLYQSAGGFRNYFRWKLSSLLKIYTDYGTDPSLAIVNSMYVILIFGVFYFFFPSEWDVTSKSKLIQDFKDFTQKNDKGYIRPFLSMLLGFIISLINALTLSLNAFTTLGFGRIPAKGLAKYVCIIQGFIGWFLLSIFTVALINQVLA